MARTGNQPKPKPQSIELEQTNLFPVQISKDEAPTPLPTAGPFYFPSPLLFHLSRAQLGEWHSRSVYSSFHNRLDLIREPAFYWVLYFIFQIYPCFIICKNEQVLFVLVQQTGDFVASMGQGLGLGWLPVLAIHCFFSWLALLFLELYRSFTMYE